MVKSISILKSESYSKILKNELISSEISKLNYLKENPIMYSKFKLSKSENDSFFEYAKEKNQYKFILKMSDDKIVKEIFNFDKSMFLYLIKKRKKNENLMIKVINKIKDLKEKKEELIYIISMVSFSNYKFIRNISKYIKKEYYEDYYLTMINISNNLDKFIIEKEMENNVDNSLYTNYFKLNSIIFNYQLSENFINKHINKMSREEKRILSQRQMNEKAIENKFNKLLLNKDLGFNEMKIFLENQKIEEKELKKYLKGEYYESKTFYFELIKEIYLTQDIGSILKEEEIKLSKNKRIFVIMNKKIKFEHIEYILDKIKQEKSMNEEYEIFLSGIIKNKEIKDIKKWEFFKKLSKENKSLFLRKQESSKQLNFIDKEFSKTLNNRDKLSMIFRFNLKEKTLLNELKKDVSNSKTDSEKVYFKTIQGLDVFKEKESILFLINHFEKNKNGLFIEDINAKYNFYGTYLKKLLKLLKNELKSNNEIYYIIKNNIKSFGLVKTDDISTVNSKVLSKYKILSENIINNKKLFKLKKINLKNNNNSIKNLDIEIVF